jgi:mono/diheme cytochrome c family protein
VLLRSGAALVGTASDGHESEEPVRNVAAIGVGVFALMVCATLASAQDVAKGAKVYAAQKCSSCHAIAGKGNAKGALDDVGTKLTAADIREWIVDPVGMTAKNKAARKPPMTAKYAKVSKDDLDALVAYLSSLKK